VLVHPRRIRRLLEHPDVGVVRAPTPWLALTAGLGGNVSESVHLTGAAAQQALGTTGAGVKLAVVDGGFAGLAAAIAAGELPADTVGVDFSGTGLGTGSIHGVGVAEHAADMAPGAQIHCLKVDDEVALENAADYIRDHGIRVANHSLAWVLASYYDDTGPINQIVNHSHDIDGVFWSVSSGNAAQRHWRGYWADIDGDDWLEFNGLDERMELTSASSEVCLFLNWDQYGFSVTDLDLFVFDAADERVASSESWQFGSLTPPAEAVCFTYEPAEAPYSLGVSHSGGPTGSLDITIFSFYNDLEHATAASSLMDPANAHGAFTVGAVWQAVWEDPSPPLESFSSQGPTTDGRTKPDIVAPDGTTSWSYGFLGAFGTSFSAPTVAGAAALILEQSPDLTVAELEVELRELAVDVGAPGPDNVYGAGQLDVAEAFDSDADLITDTLDNCPYTPNPLQEDGGGVGSSGADGIGDPCQCGDVTNNGQVSSEDLAAIREHVNGIPGALAAPAKCNAVGPASGGSQDCRIDDWAIVRRAIAGLGPGIQAVCTPALPD
jgi:hypothetical protein